MKPVRIAVLPVAGLQKRQKTDIYEHLKSKQPREGSMSFVRQQSPKGLGHAVWCARDIVGNEPFAVLLPDVLIQSQKSCLAQMMEAYHEVGGNIIAVDAVPEDRVSSYGVIKPKAGEDYKGKTLINMDGMVEKPSIDKAPSNLIHAFKYEGKDYDCGSKIGYLEAVMAFAQTNRFIGEDAKKLIKRMASEI